MGRGGDIRRHGTLDKKVVIGNLMQGWTSRRIRSEDLLDQDLRVARDGSTRWELIFIVMYAP
jgi:hypothetical protein